MAKSTPILETITDKQKDCVGQIEAAQKMNQSILFSWDN